MSRIQANLLLLLAGAIWGMGFVAQSTAMGAVGPWTYTACRFTLATLTILPFALAEARRAPAPIARGARRGFVLIGLAIFVGSILQQIGLLTTTATNAGFLTGLYVVMTPVLAIAVLGSRPHWVVWPAALLALVGILLVGGGSLSALGIGDQLVIVGALFWALQIILVGRFSAQTGRPLTLACTQFAVAAVLATLGTFAFEAPTLEGLSDAWTEIVYGGVFSIGIAFTLQTIGQRHTTAPQAAIFLSSEALFAALFGAIFLGERIPAIGFLGCALIFTAMLAVELVPLYRPKARLERPNTTGA